ncbi:MAG: hypothetical protein ACJAQ4_001627 [Cryomorphaceae bacterium]|jgi:hypothetical protein
MRATNNIFRLAFLFALVFTMLTSCEDLLDQKPPADGGNLLPEDAVETADDLQEILISAYDVLANTYNGDLQNLFNLLTDNIERPISNDDYTSVWLRSSSIFNGNVGQRFSDLSIAVLRSNTVLENLDNVTGMDEQTRNRLEAEAHFIRALCHFDAVRGWAQPYDWTSDNSHPGVAIRLQTDIENSPRASVGEVYSQILSDLELAKNNLPEMNEVYANRWAALALEAEVRFQMHEYDRAYDLANQVLTQGPFMFDNIWNRYQFPQASSEAIFYIFSVVFLDDRVDSRSGGFTGNYYSGPDQVTTLNFTEEFHDLITQSPFDGPRDTMFTVVQQEEVFTYVTEMFAPTPDRNTNDYNVPILSLTQLKLIRAESAAELVQNKDQAIQDINDIRERAYESNAENLIPSATFEEVIEAARLERRLEFPVSGQRLHDLKRIGSQGEDVIIRGVPYDCPGMILQFPSTEGTDIFPLNQSGGC